MNLSDETWLSKNHPVRFACGLIAHSAILLAGGLALIWLLDHFQMPDFSLPNVMRPDKQITETFGRLTKIVEGL